MESKKNELRQRIREEYEKTFNQLEESCRQQAVPLTVIPKRENTIMAKTMSENILVLRNNMNTDAFFAEVAAKIWEEVNKRKPYIEPEGKHGAEEKAKDPLVVNKHLDTRTTKPLTSEGEVDTYLQNLKKQIMKDINEGNSVMIIK